MIIKKHISVAQSCELVGMNKNIKPVENSRPVTLLTERFQHSLRILFYRTRLVAASVFQILVSKKIFLTFLVFDHNSLKPIHYYCFYILPITQLGTCLDVNHMVCSESDKNCLQIAKLQILWKQSWKLLNLTELLFEMIVTDPSLVYWRGLVLESSLLVQLIKEPYIM